MNLDASLIVALTSLVGLFLAQVQWRRGRDDQRDQQAIANELAAREQAWDETVEVLGRLRVERDQALAERDKMITERDRHRRRLWVHMSWDHTALLAARSAGVAIGDPPPLEDE